MRDKVWGLTATKLELLLGLVGAGAVAAIVGYLLLAAGDRREGERPQVAVTLAAAQPGESGWVVPFTAENRSAFPAQQILIEARLELVGGEVERGLAVVDFLGARSTAEGGFVFSRDPGLGRLAARTLGFVQP